MLVNQPLQFLEDSWMPAQPATVEISEPVAKKPRGISFPWTEAHEIAFLGLVHKHLGHLRAGTAGGKLTKPQKFDLVAAALYFISAVWPT
jgi:hypothetical protein